MGDLKDVQSTDQFSLTDSLLAVLTKSVAGKATLPLVISTYITQTSKDDKKDFTRIVPHQDKLPS